CVAQRPPRPRTRRLGRRRSAHAHHAPPSPGRRPPGDPLHRTDPRHLGRCAMSVIDVDTHWEILAFAPGSHPLEPWLDRFPTDPIEQLAQAIAGDLLDALPPGRRPAGAALLPGLVQAAESAGGPVILHPRHD